MVEKSRGGAPSPKSTLKHAAVERGSGMGKSDYHCTQYEDNLPNLCILCAHQETAFSSGVGVCRREAEGQVQHSQLPVESHARWDSPHNLAGEQLG